MARLIHATSVAIDGRAVLLEGPSGAGKSDLALRLIDRGALLVSDDYSLVTAIEGALIASAPERIAGLMEVRGVGIISMSHADRAPVALIVKLGGPVERLPEPRDRVIASVTLPELSIDPFEGTAALKVELAMRRPIAEAA